METPNINKRGIWTSGCFYEPAPQVTYSDYKNWKPAAAKTNNTCMHYGTRFDQITDVTLAVELRIVMDIAWSDWAFDSTSGTPGLYFQGANYSIADAGWKWSGTNYLTNALNTTVGGDLKTLVLSATSGTKHVDKTFTIPVSWFDTFLGSQLGVRCDYTDGNGTISFTNMKLYVTKYDASEHLKVNPEFVASDFLYEI